MFVVFNRPAGTPGNSADTIDSFVLDLFRCASAGSRVRGSFFHWTNSAFANSLGQIASDRNLKLRLTTGESGQTSGQLSGVQGFFGSIERGIAAPVDPDGFMNHSKFLLFRKLDFSSLALLRPGELVGPSASGVHRALYVASANIDEDNKQNQGVVVPVSKAIYDLVRAYAEDLYSEYEESTSPFAAIASFVCSLFGGEPSRADRYATASNESCKVYLYPRRSGVDTIRNVLERILHYSQESDEPCRIRLVTPRFRDSRKNIANALEKLHKNGAQIEVVTRSRTDPDSDEVPELGSDVHDILHRCATLYYQRSDDDVNIHSKYLLVDAPYLDSGSYSRQRLVWCGTPNMTKSAIDSHWEMLVKIYESAGAFDAFVKDFEYLKVVAASLHSTPS